MDPAIKIDLGSEISAKNSNLQRSRPSWVLMSPCNFLAPASKPG